MDTDEAQPMTREEISDTQWIVQNVLLICTASLSVIGSSTILFKIMRDRSQNGSTTPYDRIVFGLSGCDIVASITWVLYHFLPPRELSANVWAIGNQTTCQAIGFLSQLSLSAWWYTCVLSYYFLLTVISQVRRKNFVRRFELFLHLSVLFFPITATIGLLRGWYGCIILDDTIYWIIAGIPVFFIYLSLIINNIVIYAVVRRSLQSSEHAVTLTSVQRRLKREATTLMFLYIGCFFVTVSPVVIKEILKGYFGFIKQDVRLYPLELLANLFQPLQGFLNFFIYIKPMYTRFRAANPDKSMRFVLHQALFDPNVPQLNHSTNLSTSTDFPDENAANPNRALFKSDFRPHSSSSDLSSSSDPSEGGISDHNLEEDAKEEE